MKNNSHASRRSFLLTGGAALSAPLALAPIALHARGATLDDASAIHDLHHSYSQHLNARAFEEVVKLFAPDSQVQHYGKVYVGRDKGVRRLYVDRFSQSLKGLSDQPAHVFVLNQPHQQDVVEVTPDGRAARAGFHRLVEVQSGLDSNLPLVEMARQQGQGLLHWWEVGVFQNRYARQGDSWKLTRLVYEVVWKDDESCNAVDAPPSRRALSFLLSSAASITRESAGTP